MAKARQGFDLPRPERVRLDAFSLFEREPTIEVDFTQAPVFCLVGANGLGKSTFLAAIAYAITGAVGQPDRKFRNASDYYKQTRAYAASYFRGRIKAEDEQAAQITLEMTVGDHFYRLTRGMFEPDGLRALEIFDSADNPLVEDGEEMDDEERHGLYKRHLLKDTGLEEFSQLVFLQLFILSFDERRALLFWTSELMEEALRIAFGLDSERAREIAKLAARVEALESNARNDQWEATRTRKHLASLLSAGEEILAEADDTVAEQERLQEQRDEALEDLEAAARAVSDAQLQLAERTSALRALRSDYNLVWSERLGARGHPGSHPVVARSLEDRHCMICGTEGDRVVKAIEGRLEKDACPLCDSEIKVKDGAVGEDPADRLQRLDQEIVATQTEISSDESMIERVERDHSDRRDHLAAIDKDLAEFELKNEAAIASKGDSAGGLKAVEARFKTQIAEAQKKRDRHRKERDAVRRKLKPLQDELVNSYAAAENDFVPAFTELARKFLGLELTIEIERKTDKVGLVLSVEGQNRRTEDALSESQRFFVDIALRMALIQQMSANGAPGCLCVDTPEGSLDIAYESKAGEMFAQFVDRGFELLMTANINTSKLLQRLASRRGKRGIALERMTEWTHLSDVQIAEEEAFEEAWREILASQAEGSRARTKGSKKKK
ncbi:MAG TPA: AAA family ATPase [Solirubrobacterales bacterium]|nr:AAA family ATPase [Solirubrobacterales bacterium]